MNLRVITAVTAAAALSWLKRHNHVVCERNELRNTVAKQQEQLTEMQSKYDQVPAEMRRRIARQAELGYQLPSEGVKTVQQTLIGEVKLVAPRGYYTGTAIFVYGLDGFSQEIADAFLAETDGEFRMERAPGNSQGGHDLADAIISAGHDYRAYCAGEQGYFKCSPAPRLDKTADILSRLIVQFYGGVPAHS